MEAPRFALGLDDNLSASEVAAAARRAEELGYHEIQFGDHLGHPAPLVQAGVAAAATSSVRIGFMVLNNDFRHPALLARDVATLDQLSGGRVTLGLGAGYMEREYVEAGIPYDTAPVRIARLGESIEILRGLFAGETVDFNGTHYALAAHQLSPPPVQGAKLPILVGGNGDRLLTVAGRQADIVNLTGFSAGRGTPDPTHFTREGLIDRIGYVRSAAGGREVELGMHIQHLAVTDDVGAAIAAEWKVVPHEVVRASPFVILGPLGEVVERVQELVELGVRHFSLFEGRTRGGERVIAALR